MSYWDLVLPTYIENWPPAMCSMSTPQIDVPLTLDEAERLGGNIVEFNEGFNNPGRPIDDVRDRVSSAVEKMPNGAFVRLGSRSPKDSWEGHETGMKVMPGTDPLRFMLDVSERMYEDLSLAVSNNYAPHIFVRQWVTIPRWAEFRCFMRDRKLVGISQYQYLEGEVFQEVVADNDTLEWVIRDQFFPNFKRASHLDDVVFDVFVLRRTMQNNTRVWEVKLLEINPFFELTDPCLFAWKDGLDGSFRYNT